jgi:hypothetical protein
LYEALKGRSAADERGKDIANPAARTSMASLTGVLVPAAEERAQGTNSHFIGRMEGRDGRDLKAI